MTNPDAPESKALAAANAIAEQVGQLWWAAHADGVRNGMEAAANFAGEAANKIADDYSIDTLVRDVSVNCLNQFRDLLRLFTLQMPDPDPPAGKP
ncbi:hypothetical protein [Mycolicibacterium goodii]|uniref:Uncharacterized protein n=1 Tax=Mycolicibacterium goodii TaxID=134601 RepID=A0ABS6HRI7_MYCGD|nr:hypothetical protein [Mycolicibacterium goodii]MBU8824150.1 hypothetical protein [Mycolicibacterium goodii]MBU8838067.1 hypothetical protein [Mycolicibacterium goodii]